MAMQISAEQGNTQHAQHGLKIPTKLTTKTVAGFLNIEVLLSHSPGWYEQHRICLSLKFSIMSQIDHPPRNSITMA